MKVKNIFNTRRSLLTKGDVGVEIEVEGENLPTSTDSWRAVDDDSLRGESVEYVTRNVHVIGELAYVLKELKLAYRDNKSTIHNSVRAGTHIHVNVQELEDLQLFNFISLYIVLEELLVKYCGESREGNLFCLRVKDAEYLMYTIERMAEDKAYSMADSDIIRYSSLNLCSLYKFGSLEFRAMRGTKDLMSILCWAKVLVNLREVSCKYESPKELCDAIKADTEGFLNDCFRELRGKFIPDKIDYNKIIKKGLTRANHLCYNTDWNSFKTVTIGGLEFPVGTEAPNEPLEDF